MRRCRALAVRREPGTVLLDGDHLVETALDAGVTIDELLTDGTDGPLAARAAGAGAAVHEGTSAVLEAARPVRASGGVVAIARWSPLSADAVFSPAPVFLLGLVDVQDPGNVGGAIRSADALGASAVIALDGSADPAGWRALRGAMGSTFRVAVARGAVTEVTALARAHGVQIAVTTADGGEPPSAVDLTAPTLLLVGNEGAGLDPDIVASADRRITIPMRPGVNSLNVSVTAALLLWERQRQLSASRRTP